ncbi:helix-turn-helix domain-containing protein [Sphingomonas naphthae]|uniref:Helix-turn-helix domain-containing protein n=1 Tax=Sphingomonas naphthae TaxID=1813468 RepID=A0ABY7TGQ8_9SPHN|nr:helix-turn-helix domain-containing protein [Sphingomonas naphthae]WCT71907.1 helix-turn-helix domain-containing protein [Sphingomonas naphthae]
MAQSEDTGVRHVGETLRATREQQLLTIEAIAERTRIPIRHLLAIEAGDYAAMPAVPYAAGFVKGYAQALGLDGPLYSRLYRDELNATSREQHYTPAPYEPADPARVPSKMIAIVGVLLAVVAVLGYLLWRGAPSHDAVMQAAAGTDQPAATETALPASVAPTPPPPPAPTLTGPVVLEATGPVWMQVSDRAGAGSSLFTGVLNAGRRFEIPETVADPIIKTGRPEALKVTVGDTVITQIGPNDTLVKDFSLKREALSAYTTAHPNGPPPPPPPAPVSPTPAPGSPAPAAPPQ